MNPLQHLDLAVRYDRTFNLKPAIERVVQPHTRVLDAGCGAGLLSFWAMRSGAREVVAVDIDGLELARALAKENGLTDSIRFLEADLWPLNLSGEQNSFNVMLAMIYLNDPRRDERQSELTYALRERFLAPGGKTIPDRVRYLAQACDWSSQDHATRLSRIEARIADLEGRYGLGFQALRERVLASPWNPFFPPRLADGRLHLENARILSEPAPFAEIDYNGVPSSYPEAFDLVISTPGIFNTVLWTQELWFENLLLFSNESVSWVADPCMVEERARCTVQINDIWRRQNVLTVML